MSLTVTSSRSPHSKLGKHLQGLISGAGGADLAHGIYRLQVEGTEGGIFIIFVGNDPKIYENQKNV
ncbi:hypothetical protein E2C01_075527 [Portunus trituberculatus]|uniref:Uncharacterized protein n=1 Tax=Portunus trituberculatus TaxID=210409 RepID=A0A5B7IGD3_PORTR|nr:hypothetical protein [Portunus trituberculatus]